MLLQYLNCEVKMLLKSSIQVAAAKNLFMHNLNYG
jgi:hypothetical protein